MKDIGYVGNVPLEKFDGPPPEVLKKAGPGLNGLRELGPHRRCGQSILGVITLALSLAIRRPGNPPRWAQLLLTLAAVASVYAIGWLDARFALWPAAGMDFSTHTGVHVAIVASLWMIDRRLGIAGVVIALLYGALMVFQKYHSFADSLLRQSSSRRWRSASGFWPGASRAVDAVTHGSRMSDQPIRRLPLRRVLLGAFQLPWRHRMDVLRTAGVPLLACIGWTLFWGFAAIEGNSAAGWAFTFVYIVLTSWLSLTIHRMVLLDQPGSPLRLDAAALIRLARFVMAVIVIWVIYHGARLLLFSGVAVLGSRYVPAGSVPRELPVSLSTIDQIMSAVAYLVIARFVLLFPQIAIGQPFGILAALNLSRGNTWRLAVVVGLLPWLLERATWLLFRDNASDLEWSLVQVLLTFTVLIEVVALSLSHRELTSKVTEPAPPPTPTTFLTPAASSRPLSSATVLPVVITSSTMAT